MNQILNADEILQLIQAEIVDWHKKYSTPNSKHQILTDEMKNIKTVGLPKFTMSESIKKLILSHLEMWHEEDKIHSGIDEIIVPAVRNVNVLNVYRNKIVEQLDEIFVNEEEK